MKCNLGREWRIPLFASSDDQRCPDEGCDPATLAGRWKTLQACRKESPPPEGAVTDSIELYTEASFRPFDLMSTVEFDSFHGQELVLLELLLAKQ
jgi:hypothetical protein